nr:hypothetical protein [Psychrobacter sp.]
MKNKKLDAKAAWYYAWGNFLAALCALFGIVPAVLGLLSNKLDLFYQGLNFFVVSFALIMALRSGYLLSDRDLKKGWSYWLERNEDKIEKTDKATLWIIVLIFIVLIIRDFYGINSGFVLILKNTLLVSKSYVGA